MVKGGAPRIRKGRVGGRVRSQAPLVVETKGRPGRPRQDARARALVDLFAGKASVAEIGDRLKVRVGTVERWRDGAVPLVARALLGDVPRGISDADTGAGGGPTGAPAPGSPTSSSVASPVFGAAARRTVLAKETAAIRLHILEQFVRLHPPSAPQVAMISRETPNGSLSASMFCELFGIGRTAYYDARVGRAGDGTHRKSGGAGRVGR